MKVQNAEFIRSAFGVKDFFRDGRPSVAFVGRSNVGKSSLLNALLGGRKLARTSSTPGRTRSVNYFLVNRRLYFVDLPGYGYARAPRGERKKWADIAELYFREAAAGTRVVLLVDGLVGATALDVQALEYLLDLELSVIVAATKIDKVKRSQRTKKHREVSEVLGLPDGVPLVAVSARSGEGFSALWKEIEVIR